MYHGFVYYPGIIYRERGKKRKRVKKNYLTSKTLRGVEVDRQYSLFRLIQFLSGKPIKITVYNVCKGTFSCNIMLKSIKHKHYSPILSGSSQVSPKSFMELVLSTKHLLTTYLSCITIHEK